MSDEAHDCDDAGAPPLTRAETLVLWAMRAWVAGHRHGIPVLANLRTAFRNEGAPAAAEAVDDLMGFIANGAGRTIQVNCPRCRQVTEDERLLLDVVALHQQGEDAVGAVPGPRHPDAGRHPAVRPALRRGGGRPAGWRHRAAGGGRPGAPAEAAAHTVPAGATIH